MNNTFFERLRFAAEKNSSLVCVGLDPALNKLPEHLRSSKRPFFEFNRAIVDATRDLVCCYKPQAAYYAGDNRDDELLDTIAYIKETAPDVPVILDVKRGDIGTTAEQYAREAFDRYGADCATLNPYMGWDAVEPFLKREDKGAFILCRTSNPSAVELQNLVSGGKPLYEHVAEIVRDKWNGNNNAGLVIGATAPEELAALRKLCPGMWFLVPGVGAQGGDVEKVVKAGCSADGYGMAVNSSRGIIYASRGTDFAEASRRAACELRDLINSFREVK